MCILLQNPNVQTVTHTDLTDGTDPVRGGRVGD
jgi:hypothetical protein